MPGNVLATQACDMSTLSPAATAAATAVALDATEQHVWFTTLVTTVEEAPQATDEEFEAAFSAAGLLADQVEVHLQVLAQDPHATDTLAELAAAGADTLVSVYNGQFAAAGEQYDEHAWTAALYELGARWDRTEESWPQFREWFRYECAARGLGAPAQEFVDYAESRDKAVTFTEYGVPSPEAPAPAEEPAPEEEPAVSEYPELGVGDSGDWVAYAERMLSQAGY